MRTADDFYERAIIVRPWWTNGLVLPEIGWSKLDAAAMESLAVAVHAHARLRYGNNRYRSFRAAWGRHVLARCSFSDVLDEEELTYRAIIRTLEEYCPEEVERAMDFLHKLGFR